MASEQKKADAGLRRQLAAALPLLTFAAVVIGLYQCSPNFRWESGAGASPYAGDFLQEWIGGYVVRHGEYDRFYDVGYVVDLQHSPSIVGFQWNRAAYLPLVYPPFYYALISPLSALPFSIAAAVWSALLVAAAIVAIWVTQAIARRSTNDLDATWRWGRWMPVAVAVFAPFVENLNSSQKGVVCWLILATTLALLQRRRSFAAGLVFGLLAFKPHLALLIAVAMVWKRQWPFMWGGLATGCVLAAISLGMGTDVCRQYVDFCTGAADYVRTGGYDLSRAHSLYALLHSLSPNESIAKWLFTPLALAVVVALAWCLRGSLEVDSPRFIEQFSAMTIATLLLSPHLLTYDLTMLLLPIAALTFPGLATRRSCTMAAALYFACVASAPVAAAIGVQPSCALMIVAFVAITTGQLTVRGERVIEPSVAAG
ncbi:MAG: glycosyltransferase family 87 protein [Pirellulaceae bacterium]|jgi:hypothetical protein|nr:glycosyltransferase family 87 protein [Pirellulaceae bacterium]